ncbi:CDP-glycerol glycerophosphotransferase family protein [Staphylococcus arlettae]|uniref:CDP-glycerol glycerophosphotransferase family protein n=1 Tax=Staphylococcus arlettae TaxID=29378 RepID=UPI001E28C50A|nr:CDP-glycerol glycerophosphotransferase family protein [Staphylococcus arlettae]MCD8816419.1 CDP-glycerol glycerophosphotransferase family protein [Staphylococcus arlettae]
MIFNKKKYKKVIRSKKYHKEKPIISVIVPVYNAADYLKRNVESYQKQVFKDWELILVNDGSTDNSLSIMQDLVDRYSNITIVDKNNGGVSDARNSGVDLVRSEFLFFIDPDDRMKWETLDILHKSIVNSGSDVAITGYDLVYGDKIKPPGIWIQNLFGEHLINVSVKEHPEILQSSTPWGKLIRTEFYRKNNLGFIKGIHYEDQIFTSELYTKAKGIDVVPGYYIHWVQRANSITHQKNQTYDLQSRFNAADKSLEILSEEYELKQERLVQYLNHDFRFSLLKFRVISEEFDQILLKNLPRFYQQLDKKSRVASIMDTAYRLTLNKKYEELYEYINETNLNYHKAKLVENEVGEAVVDYSTFDFINIQSEVSPHEIQTEEVIPEAKLYDMTIDENNNYVEFTIQAYLKKLAVKNFEYKVTANIIRIDESTAEDLDLIQSLELVNTKPKTQYTRDIKEWWFDNADTFYKLYIPTSNFKYNTAFRIQLNIKAGIYVKNIDLINSRNNTNVQYNYVNINSREQIRRKTMKDVPLYFKKVPIATITNIFEKEGNLVLNLVSGSPLVGATLYSKENEKIFRVANLNELDSEYVITVPISDILEITQLATSNLISNGKPKFRFLGIKLVNINNNLILPTLSQQNISYLDNILVRNNNKANFDIVLGRTVNVENVKISEDKLNLTVNVSNSIYEVNDVIVRLTSKSKSVEYRYEIRNNSSELLIVPLTYYFYGDERLLPLSKYKISVWVDSTQDSFASQTETFTVNEAYIRSLPFDYYNENKFHHYKIEYQTKENRLYITSFNNIFDDHKGGYGWGKLLTNYKLSKSPIDLNKVLMISYMGDVIDNNLTEMNLFLTENQKYGKTIYWAVKDRTYRAPKGTIPVIIGSYEWFDILAKAGFIFFNVHQNIYVDKKPGQTFVQFFHGYPFKGMGSLYYNEMEYTDKQKYDFARREAEWDYVISPSPYATPLYKKYFNLSDNVKMIEVGYPRNDELVKNRNHPNQEILQNIHKRLNIPHDKKIILYAPTFREYVLGIEDILNVRGKEVQVLDLNQLAQDLGDDFVILARGHYSYTRGNRHSQDSERVIDVTNYPDINDLILISDVAILDYSSLRFDYAQTFKPVIFYIPDYDKYFEKRSGLMPYEDTVFGPMVMNYRELVKTILTIDEWRSSYKKQYNQFISNYTPLEDGNSAERISNIIFQDNKQLVYKPKKHLEQDIVWKPKGVRPDIDNFYTDVPKNGKVKLLTKQPLFNAVDFHNKSKTGQSIPKNMIVDVVGIRWTKGGTPRFLLKDGLYLSANRKNVSIKIQTSIGNVLNDEKGKINKMVKKLVRYTNQNLRKK